MLRILAAGARPAWYRPASGRAAPVGGLPAARDGYLLTRAGGGWMVQAAWAPRRDCSGCPVPPRPVYFLADGGRRATRAGAAQYAAPAAAPGALWLTSIPAGPGRAPAAGRATEVSAAGKVLAPPARLPPGYLIARGTDRGLLLQPLAENGQGGPDRLWAPGSPDPGRAVPGLIAASACRLALAGRCAPRCRIRVLRLAAGLPAVITLPPGSSAAAAAFSPDGRYLAVQLSKGSGGDDGGLAMQLAVAPASGGRLVKVPGTWASSDALTGFGWPSGADVVVAEFSFTSAFQLVAWQPGAPQPAVAVVRDGQVRARLMP